MLTYLLILGLPFTVFFAWQIMKVHKYRRQLTEGNNSVRVGKDMRPIRHSLILCCAWVIITTINITVQSSRIDDIKNSRYVEISVTKTVYEDIDESMLKHTESLRNFYIVMLGMFVLMGAMFTAELIKGKYVLITPNGVYYFRSFIPAKKLRYTIKDGKLLLYYKESKSPTEYSVKEDNDRLETILSENYSAFT